MFDVENLLSFIYAARMIAKNLGLVCWSWEKIENTRKQKDSCKFLIVTCFSFFFFTRALMVTTWGHGIMEAWKHGTMKSGDQGVKDQGNQGVSRKQF